MTTGPLHNKTSVAHAAGERSVTTRRPGASLPAVACTIAGLPRPAALDCTAQAGFDATKVEQVAQAIREGRFEVNAEAIADKLIANVPRLLVQRLN